MEGCEAGCVGVVGVRAHAAANDTQTQTLNTADPNATDLFSTYFVRACLVAHSRAGARRPDAVRCGTSESWRWPERAEERMAFGMKARQRGALTYAI